MVTKMGRALERWGGMLVAPRATVRSAAADEGKYDAMWLTLLYLIGAEVWSLIGTAAEAIAVDNGPTVALAGVGKAVLAPLIAGVAVDLMLGAGRRHRRGVCLVPLVVIGTLGHYVMQMGWWKPSPTWLPAAIGVLSCVAWAAFVRPAIAVHEKPEATP